MVTCEEGGFRLGGPGREQLARAPSVSSSYKQKIDALFDDSRSVASLRAASETKVSHRLDAPLAADSTYCRSKIDRANNSVQDRIERMFAELAGEAPLTASAFSVHYLGRAALPARVSSLAGLQAPLRDLYLAHRRSVRRDPAGRLEISKSGLKVRHRGERGELEQLNPFPTIAVWSAVKFVVQADAGGASCAFLPLITDPDSIDRRALFHALDPAEAGVLSDDENTHSPIFAVVMRKIGVAKQLECHGFVCQSSEDAIVIAATLYKSLMSHMSRQCNAEKKKLKNRNGVSCMSVASSASPRDAPQRPPRRKHSAASLSGDSDRADGFSASESLSERPAERAKRTSSEELPPPPPPPAAAPAELKRITVEEVKAKLDSIAHDTSGTDTQQSKKSARAATPANKVQQQMTQSSSESSTRSTISDKIELFRQLERRRSLQRPPSVPPPVPLRPPSEPPPEPPVKEPLRRNHSGRQSLNDSGDILTKVAIPRSGSFLNAGGLTRYKSIGHRNNGKKGGGSPLGFNELFNEFKVQENLHSMDDILSAIIDAEGMSFNDLKPIYKEFLLKLAVTLTKDEIFQHSKAIMKKQKKKILRRNSTFQNKRRKIFKGASGLRMVFRLPFGKDVRKKEKKKHHSSFDTPGAPSAKVESESGASNSSYDIRQFRPKEPPLPPPKRQSVRQRPARRPGGAPAERTSSEDSDFLTLSNRLGGQNRNSSSGYVSCSECESDGCVDRCYCSLRGGPRAQCCCSADLKKTRLSKSCKVCSNRESFAGDVSYCSCDSESCADSGKCYCPAPRPPRPAHPPPHAPRAARAPRAPRAARAPRASQSLEYLRSPSHQVYSERLRRAFDDNYEYSIKGRTRSVSSSARRRRRARSSDDLALDYELLLNQPRSDRSLQRLTVRSTGAGSHDALSVKKSAEMAALFADVRLSQRTDVRAPRRPPPRPASLEDTLGYLP